MKFALIGKLPLAMLHVSPDPQDIEGQFPKIRETLVRWQVLPADCGKEAVAAMGLEVDKFVHKHRDPVRAVTKYIRKHRVGLLVLASHPRKPGARLLRPSMAELISRESRVLTLFVPDGVQGFVSAADGSITLRRVLVPLSRKLVPQAPVDAAARAVRNLKCRDTAFTLLHVGRHLPDVGIDLEAGAVWDKVVTDGNVVSAILDTAEQTKADLIVMATDGRKNILDTLRGTTTERVMRRSPCPLLAVPIVD